MNIRPWTSTEIRYLRDHAADGRDAISQALDRTIKSVENQARKQRISLRRRGSRSGLLLGQPRGVSWKGLRADGVTARTIAELREWAADGRIDLAEVERQLRALADGEAPPVCPACGVRTVDHHSGFCRVCHMRALAQLHREAADAAEAQRTLWTERQRKHRRRKA